MPITRSSDSSLGTQSTVTDRVHMHLFSDLPVTRNTRHTATKMSNLT
ncbi:hypothetical protein FHX42_004095 [Saccharopolyspora lacisalsi]|uniref:Uncharacterized protein n=1 Tax=Halosaccharopolyspora lacisalsi TaxID=1000566 RepID=A0A839E2C6_9PSEU|nr:hypothetical protein [Halosaccharopolyspora lacisalsi]